MARSGACVQGRVYAPPDEEDEDSDAIRHFNETVLKDPRVEVVTMPVRDGMSIVRRRNLADADAVATGVGGANILQRLRLNSKVALITGAPNTDCVGGSLILCHHDIPGIIFMPMYCITKLPRLCCSQATLRDTVMLLVPPKAASP